MYPEDSWRLIELPGSALDCHFCIKKGKDAGQHASRSSTLKNIESFGLDLVILPAQT
jgi:hypothetical protein